MQLTVVSSCTDRKRFPTFPSLDASDLPRGQQDSVAVDWVRRVVAATPAAKARDVYCGRNFQEALTAARSAEAPFQIMSAGMGLIGEDEPIPAYNLTLVRASRSWIGSRISPGVFEPGRWWGQVQRGKSIHPLADLLRSAPTVVVAIGISGAYLPLVTRDLESLDDVALSRVRLFGLGIEGACPIRLQPSIMPYDERFDGPDGKLRGTRTDFASRVLRHFVEHIFTKNRDGSLSEHKELVSRALAGWRPPARPVRESKSDHEIIGIILKTWSMTKGQSARALRYLRDVEKVACEQGRFRHLFHSAAKQVNS